MRTDRYATRINGVDIGVSGGRSAAETVLHDLPVVSVALHATRTRRAAGERAIVLQLVDGGIEAGFSGVEGLVFGLYLERTARSVCRRGEQCHGDKQYEQ